MPFDGHAGHWEPGRREPRHRLPKWLPYALVTFGAVMGGVFGLQAAIATGLFCNLVLAWPHALMTVPTLLFQPFAIVGGCLGGCVAIRVARHKSLA
jgi:hypothetical protein